MKSSKLFLHVTTLSLILTVVTSQHQSNQTISRDRVKRQPNIQFCSDRFDQLRTQVLRIGRRTGVLPPATAAYVGAQGQVLMVEAVITRRNLDTGSAPTPQIRTHARRLGGPTDDAGHIIADRLGGTGRAAWNIFPQSVNFNRGTWRQQEDTVYNIAQRGNQVAYTVILEYQNGGTRPVRVWYRWQYRDARGNHCFSGDVLNPPSRAARGRGAAGRGRGAARGRGRGVGRGRGAAAGRGRGGVDARGRGVARGRGRGGQGRGG